MPTRPDGLALQPDDRGFTAHQLKYRYLLALTLAIEGFLFVSLGQVPPGLLPGTLSKIEPIKYQLPRRLDICSGLIIINARVAYEEFINTPV